MSISNRVEDIFAHAVAMEQSGRLRSTIYCIGNQVYILNADNTVLLRFGLRKSETPFEHPVSFRANDYDSKDLREKNGKIIFTQKAEGFSRSKSCAAPGSTPEEVEALFKSFAPINSNSIHIPRSMLSLLDESLSHLEFKTDKDGGKMLIIQRNIYTGAIIRVRRSEGEGLDLSGMDTIQGTFGPFGIRTPDFLALFAFTEAIKICFPKGTDGDYVYIASTDPKVDMEGILSCCLYDELGNITITKKGEEAHGRKEQKNRKC